MKEAVALISVLLIWVLGVVCVGVTYLQETKMNKEYITSTYGPTKYIVSTKGIKFIQINEPPQSSVIKYDDGSTININKTTAEKVAETICNQ